MEVSEVFARGLSKFARGPSQSDYTAPQTTGALSAAQDAAVPNSWVTVRPQTRGLGLPPLASLPMALDTARVPLTLQQSM